MDCTNSYSLFSIIPVLLDMFDVLLQSLLQVFHNHCVAYQRDKRKQTHEMKCLRKAAGFTSLDRLCNDDIRI